MKNILVGVSIAIFFSTPSFAIGRLKYAEEFEAYGLHAAPLTGANAQHLYEAFPELLNRQEAQGKDIPACVDQIIQSCKWLRDSKSHRLNHPGDIPALTITPWVISQGYRIVAFLEPEFLSDHTFSLLFRTMIYLVPGSSAMKTIKTRNDYRHVARDFLRTFNTFNILLSDPTDPVSQDVLRLMTHHLIFPHIGKPVAAISPFVTSVSSVIYGGAIFMQSDDIVTANTLRLLSSDGPTTDKVWETRILLQDHLEQSYPFGRRIPVEGVPSEPYIYILDEDAARDTLSPPPPPPIEVSAPEAGETSEPTSPPSPTSPKSPPPPGLAEIIQGVIAAKQKSRGVVLEVSQVLLAPEDFDEDDDEEDQYADMSNPWRETETGSPPPPPADDEPVSMPPANNFDTWWLTQVQNEMTGNSLTRTLGSLHLEEDIPGKTSTEEDVVTTDPPLPPAVDATLPGSPSQTLSVLLSILRDTEVDRATTLTDGREEE